MPVKQLSDSNTDGTVFGQAAADKVSFYGFTPVSQRATSLGATSAVSASSASYGSLQAAVVTEIINTLVGLGIMKGGA
jgi:hypothetical protein